MDTKTLVKLFRMTGLGFMLTGIGGLMTVFYDKMQGKDTQKLRDHLRVLDAQVMALKAQNDLRKLQEKETDEEN